jgi:hypothetical protein
MKSAVLLKNYSLDKTRDIKKAQPHLAWHNKVGFARILALSNSTGLITGLPHLLSKTVSSNFIPFYEICSPFKKLFSR